MAKQKKPMHKEKHKDSKGPEAKKEPMAHEVKKEMPKKKK